MNALEYGSALEIALLPRRQRARRCLVFVDWSYHGGLIALQRHCKFLNEIFFNLVLLCFILGILYCAIMSSFCKLGHILCTRNI